MRKNWVYWLALAASLLIMAFFMLRDWPTGNEVSLRPSENQPMAVSSISPETAYDEFYKALSAGNIDGAMQFLSAEMRDEFRREIAVDVTALQRHLADKAQLQVIEKGDCGPHEPACVRYAVYEHDYEVIAGYWETIGGKEFYVSPGSHRLEMRFIQLADGSWQISEL